MKGVHGPFGVVFPEAVDHSIYDFLIPFPQLLVPECMLPEQEDGHNCGIIWLIVCFDFVLNHQNQKWCFEDGHERDPTRMYDELPDHIQIGNSYICEDQRKVFLQRKEGHNPRIAVCDRACQLQERYFEFVCLMLCSSLPR